jgi:tRNA(fMet)-specific endonuclease VapC
VTWLLDTNACIEYLRAGSGSRIAERLARAEPEDVVLCSIVRAELIFGALRSRDVSDNVAHVARFVSQFTSFPFDDDAAEAYGAIRAALVGQGMTIGPNDLLIAAIARARDLTLVSHNVDEFRRVPGLRIEDWEAE